MEKLIKLPWIFLVIVLLTSCAGMSADRLAVPVGQVIELSEYTTIGIVQDVIRNRFQQSWILQSNDNSDDLLLIRTLGSRGVALYAIDMATVSYRNVYSMIGRQTAYLANCVEAICLVDYLKTVGWKVVTSKDLEIGRLVSALTTAYTSLPTFGFIWVDDTYMEDLHDLINPPTYQE